ncbi:XRE family transcriptional regulator [Agrobacterium rosae]|uniref:XRE family transcriptional regulator n=1 Tax=Agrobacterium rosae TaxID=1972867 RepID=A0AAW9FPD6_9HYPH|nr:XRE family transcriptional regulator [Agrobacterium rosae]MDX8304359.1 XRE family transcriptional regulator [Agrobacterium rosae]
MSLDDPRSLRPHPSPTDLRLSGKVLRSRLRHVLAATIADQDYSQTEAARICETDQPTLSKVMADKTDSVTIDQLTRWLAALGCEIELHLKKPTGRFQGRMTVVVHD